MKFKSLLEEQQRNLLSARSLSKKISLLQKNEMIDEGDLASEELGMESWMKLCERESAFLKKIESALQRINKKVFGLCKDCGGKIEFSILKASPTALYCGNCKEENERLELLFASAFVKKKPSSKKRAALRISALQSWTIKVTG